MVQLCVWQTSQNTNLKKMHNEYTLTNISLHAIFIDF